MKPAFALVLAALIAGAAIAKPPPASPPPPPPLPSAPTEADWRTLDPQNVLIIETNKGRILVELAPLVAPQTVAQVIKLTRAGVYDGRSFFRVIDNFMDQTGDPLDSGMGASSMPNVPPEFMFKRGSDSPFAAMGKRNGQEEGFIGSMPIFSQTMDLGLLTVDHKVQAWGGFCPGVLGFARSDDVNSGNSQFFIMRTSATTADHGNHALDQQYTAFGKVLAGQDVVDAIKTGEPVPAPQDKVISVKVLADIPEAQRPTIRVVDAHSDWAQLQARRLSGSEGPDYSVCLVNLPVDVRMPAQPK